MHLCLCSSDPQVNGTGPPQHRVVAAPVKTLCNDRSTQALGLRALLGTLGVCLSPDLKPPFVGPMGKVVSAPLAL